MNTNQRKENWSRFWESSTRSSCASGVESDSSEINDFWEKCAVEFGEKDLILDLCTGKGGAIGNLIDHQLKEKRQTSSFIGIDISEVDVSSFLEKYKNQKDRIKFFHSTSIENLPLEDDSIDKVISQFGFEYILTDKSYSEISRVLKPNGQMSLVLHHSNSILMEVAKIELEHIDYLENESPYFEHITKLIPIFAMLRNPANVSKLKNDKKAELLRENFNKESNILLKMIADSNCPDILREALDISKVIFQRAQESGPAAAKLVFKDYLQEMQDSKLRSIELIEAALSEDDISLMEKKIRGFDKKIVECEALKSDGYIVAWGIKVA